MVSRQRDMTPLVDLRGRSGSGAVRRQLPVYVDLLPPCNHACPAGEDIQGWLSLAQAGRWRDAWEALVRDNPLPGVHGRVCYHPCESACNRGELDAAVRIHAIERFLGDRATAERWPLRIEQRASGRRVLVVGAGPSGLSAAYHLARLGHTVEVRDAAPLAGGMMQFGIPAYRLPREVLAMEVRRIEALGVSFRFQHRVEDLLSEQHEGRFDAVFLAIGAGVGRRVDVPARDAAHVLDAVTLLHDVSAGSPPLLGRRVLVYGGGNTAMDAARTARRLGAEQTLIVYRRDKAHMPAQAFELQEATEEGIQVKWLHSIKEVSGQTVTVEQIELDAEGRPQPTGRMETLSADAVVLAVGQQSDSAFLHNVAGIELTAEGSVRVGADMMTGREGVFAGGDLVPGPPSVTLAVGHGRRAARHIDAWLHRGQAARDPTSAVPRHPLVSYAMLHLPVYSDAEPSPQSTRSPAERLQGFAEVVAGLDEPQARYEAQRCLSCGNCFECDGCFAACPEHAIAKLGPGRGYRIDAGKCTGCAVCFEQCPCHAIEMMPETP